MGYVERQFYCSICNTQHKLKFPENLAEEHTVFPFAYLYLHGDVGDVLSTIYLDASLNVRGVESIKLKENENNVFSKEQATIIVRNLMEELSRLQKEYNELLRKYNELKRKVENK